MYDFCVIGGGIVGLATSFKLLQKYPGSSLIILEKESHHSLHQTSHNSGVIHSGIYYKPGSMKAILCKKGNKETIQFCKKYKIKYEKCGKLIVATSKAEDKRLILIQKRAKENGIKSKYLNKNELSDLEKEIRGTSALLIPSTAIVNYKDISSKILEILTAKKTKIEYKFNVKDIKERKNHVEIKNENSTIKAKKLIVCAGVQADRLAKISGLKINFKIIPFKGEYYELSKIRKNFIRHLIYPVPDPSLPFLGIHLTRGIDGTVNVGPNAVLALSREGYSSNYFNFFDIISYFFYIGFWRFLFGNALSIFKDIKSTISKKFYLEECKKYCPILRFHNLKKLTFGIRAQMVKNDGTLVHDFEILETERMIHICNAPSPAATSAFPIGEYIVNKLQK